MRHEELKKMTMVIRSLKAGSLLLHRSWAVSGFRSGRAIAARRAASGFLLPAVVVSMLVSGCGTLDGIGLDLSKWTGKPKPRISVSWVSVAVMPNVNENWPVPVELVRVRDEALVGMLLDMDTDDWFGEGGESFRLAHPDAVFDYWEVVPGTSTDPVEIRRLGRFGGVLFCGLRESPPPPVRVAHRGRMRITVDDSGCAFGRQDDQPRDFKVSGSDVVSSEQQTS